MNHIFEEFFSNRILCCFSKNFYLEPVIVSLLIEFSVASFPKIFVSRLLLFPYRIFSCCFSENFSRAFVVVSSFVEFQFRHNKLTSYNKLIFFFGETTRACPMQISTNSATMRPQSCSIATGPRLFLGRINRSYAKYSFQFID